MQHCNTVLFQSRRPEMRNPRYILACWKDPMTKKSRGRIFHVIPRKVAKRACAVPFPTNLSALTNRSATPCVVGEVHLRHSSSLKTNARPNDWAPRGPLSFNVGGRNGYRILGPFVMHDTCRSFLTKHVDSLLLYYHVSLADECCFSSIAILKSIIWHQRSNTRQVTFGLVQRTSILHVI